MLSEFWSKRLRNRSGVKTTPPEKLVAPPVENASPSGAVAVILERHRSGITFAVDSVSAAEKPTLTETLADSLRQRFRRKILALPEEHRQVIGARCHPLIEAVHAAFSQHRPLTLSPDHIWLVIAQGFSHHVAENAEALRPRLVRHAGRQTLRVETLDLSLASFESAIAGFSSQIREATDPVLHKTLVCDFSTTTPAIRTASEVALMDSFKNYFEYAMMCVCGIPAITIEGTPEDWRRIRARIEVLETYGLEWWVSRLRPVLDEFVLAAEGQPTAEFWKAIYKPVKTYGDKVATGWITDLFPYLGDPPHRRRNHVFDHQRQRWALPVDQGVETESVFHPLANKGVGLRVFPSGLSSAPVKVVMETSETTLDLVAGFFAVQQDPSDLALSPLIGWCVAEHPPETPSRRPPGGLTASDLKNLRRLFPFEDEAEPPA